MSSSVLPPANIAKVSNYPDLPFPLDDSAQGCPAGPTQADCLRDNYSIYPVQKTFVTNALNRQDQLRQRVAFALHQITVTSGISPLESGKLDDDVPAGTGSRRLGNYRGLLNDITLNPEMGAYLDMRLSTRTNPEREFCA
jgi:uncharacterized protein (DUF1800 family)